MSHQTQFFIWKNCAFWHVVLCVADKCYTSVTQVIVVLCIAWTFHTSDCSFVRRVNILCVAWTFCASREHFVRRDNIYLQVELQSAQASSAHWASVWFFFFFQRILSSTLAHWIPCFTRSLLCEISPSGNLPSFLKMILKRSEERRVGKEC